MMDFEKLNRTIDSACEALLQGRSGEANERLSHVYDELLVLSANFPESKLKQIQPIMDIMLKAQQSQDYVYLVDILKYQLIGFLK